MKQALLRLAARCGYVILRNDDYRRLVQHAQQLKVELVEAHKNFERLAGAVADARKGHDYALRELEQSRAETYEVREQLAQTGVATKR
jgi:hypothetical protein